MNEVLPTTVRPVPRWLHAWVIFMACWTFVLLIVGQLVTTFRAGMADPIWPTEPWYLLNNYKFDFGYLVEHSHRILGWVLGAIAIVFTLGMWSTEPRRTSRWVGVVAILVLTLAYGNFHSEMRKQIDAENPVLPKPAIGAMALAFGLVGMLAISGIGGRIRGSGLRLLSVLILVAIMIQGLLGGFRVRFDVWFGTDLAAIHGIFGQIVFALIVSMSGLTALRHYWPDEVDAVRYRMNTYAVVLFVLLLTQLVWGAQIRHAPTALMQRLHLLTAFAVMALAGWMLRSAFQTGEGRKALGFGGWLLAFLLVLQVTLGVEAWMGKFGLGMMPELEVLTKKDMAKAVTRTLHTLIGSGILATTAALIVRTGVVLTSRLLLLPDPTASNRSNAFGRMQEPALIGGPQQGVTS